MRIAHFTGIFSLTLLLAGCSLPLEKGWKKEDEGKKVAAIKNFSRALVDSEETYRKLAAEELVAIGGPAVPALTEALSRKSRYYDLYYNGTRKEAAWALGEIASKEAVLPLVSTLRASRGIYREKDLLSEVKELQSRAQLAKMVKGIMDRSDEKKDPIAVAKTMEQYLDKIIKVISTAFEDKDSFYREKELATAIDRIELLQLSGKEGKKVKEEALGIIKEKLAVRMTSGTPELIAGIVALGKIGDRRAVDPLLDVLREETYPRAQTALSLARIGDRKAFPFLEEAWKKENRDFIKMNLDAALYLMGDQSKWELLVESLRERKLRIGAVKLLGEIGDKKGIGPLTGVLSDESEEVRMATVKALKQIGGEEAEDALFRTLNDQNSEVKKEAILAIAHSTKSAAALRKIAADKGEKLIVRLAADSRLGEWGEENPLPLALEVAEDNRSEDLSCLSLVDSLPNKEERRIGEEIFFRKPFWSRTPRTYNEQMLIEAIEKIGRIQDRDVQIRLRKLFREDRGIPSQESQMRIIDKSGIDKTTLRSILRAAEVEDLPAIKMLLEKLLDLEETFSDEEKIMAIVALGKTGEGKEILQEIYRDREENYLVRFEARKALRMGEEGRK